jgi:hypothetical protein
MSMRDYDTKLCVPVASIRYSPPTDLKVKKISGVCHFVTLLSTKSCLRKYLYISDVYFQTAFRKQRGV